ncbi:MAG: GNAT family N-acetyltransferase [Pseudomonadota bacterium]
MAPEIVTGWRPGVIGGITGGFGRYFARTMGFGAEFEAKVAGIVATVAVRDGPDDLVLSAWEGEAFAGGLLIDGAPAGRAPGWAQLRTFIVTAPGQGLGRRLMGVAMAHLDARGLACTLETIAGLDPARRLYEAHGFTLAAEAEDRTWGRPVREQRFDRPAGGLPGSGG